MTTGTKGAIPPASPQDRARGALDPVTAERKLANFLSVLTLETQTIARACGRRTSTISSRRIWLPSPSRPPPCRVPLAGTDWIPGLNARA
jgi:hypothetical protein